MTTNTDSHITLLSDAKKLQLLTGSNILNYPMAEMRTDWLNNREALLAEFRRTNPERLPFAAQMFDSPAEVCQLLADITEAFANHE